ncbi:MAG: hypothetical protein ABIR94_05900 [Rubrivivax sp.]
MTELSDLFAAGADCASGAKTIATQVLNASSANRSFRWIMARCTFFAPKVTESVWDGKMSRNIKNLRILPKVHLSMNCEGF